MDAASVPMHAANASAFIDGTKKEKTRGFLLRRLSMRGNIWTVYLHGIWTAYFQISYIYQYLMYSRSSEDSVAEWSKAPR